MSGTTAADIAGTRDVRALLATHSTGVAALKQSLVEDLKACGLQDDDVFLLRFLLSANDVNLAEEAASKALAWRKEKADMLQAAKPGQQPPPHFEEFCKFVATGCHGQTTDGDVIFVVRAGLANGKAIVAELSPDVVLDLLLFNRERVSLKMNEITRQTGRLCKAVTITDMNFASLGKLNRNFQQVLTKASKLSEIYYPQFLDTAVLINVPTVMKAVMRTMWSFLPKRLQQKLRVCPGRTLTQDISKCPFARSRLVIDTVPTFLGGTCQCPKGCIAGLANDQKESNAEVDGETGLCKWTIPAKGKYEVFVDVEAGSTLSYQVQVDKGRLSSGPVSLQVLLRSEGRETTLLPPQACSPSEGLSHGSVLCPEAGTAVFIWANAATMFSRSIRYSVHEAMELSDQAPTA